MAPRKSKGHKGLLTFKPSVDYDFRLSKNELFQYKRIFDAFDPDMTGFVACRDLPVILRAAGVNISNKGVATAMEKEEWGEDTLIDLCQFFIFMATSKRDLKAELGADFIQIQDDVTRHAFISLYADTSSNTHKDVSGKMANFVLPVDVLHRHATDGGMEPITELEWDTFLVRLPDEVFCLDRAYFDAQALFEYTLQAGTLNDKMEDAANELAEKEAKEKARQERRQTMKRASILSKLAKTNAALPLDAFAQQKQQDAGGSLGDGSTSMQSEGKSLKAKKTSKAEVKSSSEGRHGWMAPSELLNTATRAAGQGINIMKSGVQSGVNVVSDTVNAVNEFQDNMQKQLLPEEIIAMRDAMMAAGTDALEAGLDLGGIHLNLNAVSDDERENENLLSEEFGTAHFSQGDAESASDRSYNSFESDASSESETDEDMSDSSSFNSGSSSDDDVKIGHHPELKNVSDDPIENLFGNRKTKHNLSPEAAMNLIEHKKKQNENEKDKRAANPIPIATAPAIVKKPLIVPEKAHQHQHQHHHHHHHPHHHVDHAHGKSNKTGAVLGTAFTAPDDVRTSAQVAEDDARPEITLDEYFLVDHNHPKKTIGQEYDRLVGRGKDPAEFISDFRLKNSANGPNSAEVRQVAQRRRSSLLLDGLMDFSDDNAKKVSRMNESDADTNLDENGDKKKKGRLTRISHKMSKMMGSKKKKKKKTT